jgi:cytochrome c553
MKAIRLILPVAAALATFLAANVYATGDMAKKEKKPCTTCHDMKAGKPTKEKPLLNDVGKHYHEKKTLEGAPKK